VRDLLGRRPTPPRCPWRLPVGTSQGHLPTLPRPLRNLRVGTLLSPPGTPPGPRRQPEVTSLDRRPRSPRPCTAARRTNLPVRGAVDSLSQMWTPPIQVAVRLPLLEAPRSWDPVVARLLGQVMRTPPARVTVEDRAAADLSDRMMMGLPGQAVVHSPVQTEGAQQAPSLMARRKPGRLSRPRMQRLPRIPRRDRRSFPTPPRRQQGFRAQPCGRPKRGSSHRLRSLVQRTPRFHPVPRLLRQPPRCQGSQELHLGRQRKHRPAVLQGPSPWPRPSISNRPRRR
jgi:hypothetical protein